MLTSASPGLAFALAAKSPDLFLKQVSGRLHRTLSTVWPLVVGRVGGSKTSIDCSLWQRASSQ